MRAGHLNDVPAFFISVMKWRLKDEGVTGGRLPKHDHVRPGVSPQPTNGETMLSQSVPVGGNSSAQVGYDKEARHIVVLEKTRRARITATLFRLGMN